MALDILAFHAHRDDIEITCGGLLIRMAERGYAVGACDLTRGEMGTRGSAERRKAESEEAARIMGLAVRVNCELPDAGLFNVREQQERVVGVIREHQPKVVVLPGPVQRHPDHRTAGQLVFDACFFSGLEKFGRGRKHRPFKLLHAWSGLEPDRPTFCVDITAQMDRKIDAVLAYATQFPDREKWSELLRARARACGLLIGVTYAEGFSQREVMQVDDVVTLPVASM